MHKYFIANKNDDHDDFLDIKWFLNTKQHGVLTGLLSDCTPPVGYSMKYTTICACANQVFILSLLSFLALYAVRIYVFAVSPCPWTNLIYQLTNYILAILHTKHTENIFLMLFLNGVFYIVAIRDHPLVFFFHFNFFADRWDWNKNDFFLFIANTRKFIQLLLHTLSLNTFFFLFYLFFFIFFFGFWVTNE